MKGKKIIYYSQFSEDAIIDGLFKKIGTTNKLLVDIGSADGITFSNTRFFMERNLRKLIDPWSGLFVEPNEESFKNLTEIYGSAHCFNYAIDSETTIDKFLSACNYPKTFDLLDIDIDGQDYYIWADMIDYRARIVVIEWSPYVLMDFIPIRNTDGEGGKNQAGLVSMLRLARQKDYCVAAITPVNLICVEGQLFPEWKMNWDGEFPILTK